MRFEPFYGRRVVAFFGQKVPDDVAHVEMVYMPHEALTHVRWITKDGEKHSMPFEQTDECVGAVLTAMKLTC